ncbi:MAG TPA: hypothetical protein VJI52_03420 [Candidatus Nanoarchaeia archaeon]|nr:hypothetical protein [Candidatus Nanoarchaeia archaeon]
MARKFFLCLFLIVFLIGCSQKNISTPQQSQNPDSAVNKCDFDKYPANENQQKVGLPLLNKLCFLEDPIPDKPVNLIYKLRYDRGYGEGYRPVETVAANATIYLPPEFSLVDGNLNWKGNLIEKEDKEIKLTVKSTKEGYFQVGGYIFVQDIGGIGDVVYLNITQDKSQFLNPDEWLRKEGTMDNAVGTPQSESK